MTSDRIIQDANASACEACPAHHRGNLVKLGVDMREWDFVVALAGNPNTGKSTVFNALTGLRQHTGNWPGKTVSRAEGGFFNGTHRFKLVDLPGTYSLLSSSFDEEIARDFILFARPDVTVVVVDATRLERNLNLVLQVLEITDRVVVCVNLMDEARRTGIQIDERRLARDLGVPVVKMAARQEEGLSELMAEVAGVATGRINTAPRRERRRSASLQHALAALSPKIKHVYPGLPNADWVALRLLESDERIVEAFRSGDLGDLTLESGAGDRAFTRKSSELGPPLLGRGDADTLPNEADQVVSLASRLSWQLGPDYYQNLVEELYGEAARLADRVVVREQGPNHFDLDRTIDRLVTSRFFGFPLMIALLGLVFWLTISGANVPSQLLSRLLIDTVHPLLNQAASSLGSPSWLSGLLIDGMYLSTAWVISVMLPPMAIFFPLFTLLEDFGYLPRVAFNLDSLFRRAGGHGKQGLTMAMGFGCNAAGVVATRIIESPRERLIAIITNNFALCNGRWPTQILIASIIVGGLVPGYLAGSIAATIVVGVALLGVFLTFTTSFILSRTLLRGEASAFSLELPPYRPPRLWRTLYTSLIDRTLLVLWRAVVFAMPAGAIIWLLANVDIGGVSLGLRLITLFDPFGAALGLSGVILLAYVVAIPANEIVIPTILMLTVLTTKAVGLGAGAGVLFEPENDAMIEKILSDGGFTLLTGVNLMLFSLVHNPCSTTIYTIWKETHSVRWTAISALLPLVMGFVLCFAVAQLWRALGG